MGLRRGPYVTVVVYVVCFKGRRVTICAYDLCFKMGFNVDVWIYELGFEMGAT